MVKIGITGGIGSGKSVVSKILETLGYPVFNSDSVAKEIVNTDPEIIHGLKELFGDQIYKGNELNRELLAQHIFSDDNYREKVNRLIHPRVRAAFEAFAINAASPVVFNEAAILLETGAYQQFSKTILITAPKELRLKRVMQRDNVSEEAVKARMEKQWSDEKKIPLADYTICNDEKEPLLAQVQHVLKEMNF